MKILLKIYYFFLRLFGISKTPAIEKPIIRSGFIITKMPELKNVVEEKVVKKVQIASCKKMYRNRHKGKEHSFGKKVKRAMKNAV